MNEVKTARLEELKAKTDRTPEEQVEYKALEVESTKQPIV